MGLNATVTPGLTVTDTTQLNAANLNLLGTPTISITGSIDSSDIGQNTVGSSEIQPNGVTQTEIGDIGGRNYILSGDSSGNGTGLDTLAVDDNNDQQISLLVNDKTDLKPRVITGNLEVTTSGANKVNFAIKDNSISSDMLQSSALSRKVTINDIQPGGGISASGGVANISASGVTGGLIVFNPNAPTATIDGDPYYGKPQVLQPSGADQYLKSVGTKGELTFGTLAGYPAAIVSAYAQAHADHDATATSGLFNKMYSSNVHMVRRIGQTSPTVNYGMLRIFFSGGVANGDTVNVFGIGISNHAEHQMMPAVAATASQLQIDANGDEDTTDGTTYPYVDVKFIRHISSGHPKDQTGGFLQNPNFVQLTFYVS